MSSDGKNGEGESVNPPPRVAEGSGGVNDDQDQMKKGSPSSSPAPVRGYYPRGRGGWNDFRGRGVGGRGGRRRFDNETPPVKMEIPDELIPSNAVDISRDQSKKLWKVILKTSETGTGYVLAPPREGTVACITYKSWVASDPSKEIVDSSCLYEGDVDHMQFSVGKGQVIRTLDEGVQTMTKGESALFISHFDYAYGRNSGRRMETANIPNESFICTEVELVDVIDDITAGDGMREILRDIVVQGDSGQVMSDNCIIYVKLEGYFEGKVFFPEKVLPFEPRHKAWTFTDTGLLPQIPDGVADAIVSMKGGETAWITLTGASTFEDDYEDASREILIKAGQSVKYLVEIMEIEELFDPYLLSLKEKVELCKEILEKGEGFRDQGHYEAASAKFQRMEEYLREAKLCLKQIPPEVEEKCDSLYLSAVLGQTKLYGKVENLKMKGLMMYLNGALDRLKLKVSSSASADSMGMENIYSERAHLLMKGEEYEKASKDFSEAIKLVNLKESLGEDEKLLLEELKANQVKAMEQDRLQKKNDPIRYYPPK